MLTPHVHIHSVASFLPPRTSLDDAVRRGLCPKEHVELYDLVSVAIADDLPAPEMALRAATEAIERSHHAADDFQLLLYADSWHQGPDGWQPQYYLQRHLVGGDTLAVEIRHGCNGAFSALELAAGHLAAAPGPRSALVVTADNFGTPLFDRWRAGPGYIAGDGAAALVLGTEPGFARLVSVRSDAIPAMEELHRGTAELFPPGPTVGRALDFASLGIEFRERMIKGEVDPTVMLRVQQQTLDTVWATLDEAGVGVGDISKVAYMNYARDIVEQRCMAPLGLPLSTSTWEFGATVGHLGAADQLVSFEHLLATGELVEGDRLLMLGVGPGVTVSAALIEIVGPPPSIG